MDRRTFLGWAGRAGLAVGLAGCAGPLGDEAGRPAGLKIGPDPGPTDAGGLADRWALLADTHINGDPSVRGSGGEDMTSNLRAVVAEVLGRTDDRPFAGAMINGDVSHIDGQPADDGVLLGLVRPLREQMPVWLTMGNHDDRVQAAAEAWPGSSPGSRIDRLSKRVAVVRGRSADWVLLDSLDRVNVTPGRLGGEQLAWLSAFLDRPEEQDRPVLVMLHHTLQPPPDHQEAKGKPWWLLDTDELLMVLRPRRRVKALFHGHAHRWMRHELDGLHVIGQPPTAYLFREQDPLGWLSVEAAPGSLALTLNATGHARDGETYSLIYR